LLAASYFETHPPPGRPPKDVQDVLYDLQRGNLLLSQRSDRAIHAALTFIDREIYNDLDRAAVLCQQVLDEGESGLQDPDLNAYTHAIAGTIELRVSRFSTSQTHFETSLHLTVTPLQVADTLRRYSVLSRTLHDIPKALALSERALSHSRPRVVSDRGYPAAALVHGNNLYADYWAGNRPLSEARQWHEKAFDHADAYRSPRTWKLSLAMLARDLAEAAADGVAFAPEEARRLLGRVETAYDTMRKGDKTRPTGLQIKWALQISRLDLRLLRWSWRVKRTLLAIRKELLGHRCYQDVLAISLDLVERDQASTPGWTHLTDILDALPTSATVPVGQLLLRAHASPASLRHSFQLAGLSERIDIDFKPSPQEVPPDPTETHIARVEPQEGGEGPS
jgi:hypothetical protein